MNPFAPVTKTFWGMAGSGIGPTLSHAPLPGRDVRSPTVQMTATALDTVQVDGLTIAYRELGSGPPVLLLHGWPTSSFLWRDVMEPIAEHNRVVAIDLPGFGASDKPLGVRYDFDLFEPHAGRLPGRARHRGGRPRGARPRRAGRACIGRCTARSA